MSRPRQPNSSSCFTITPSAYVRPTRASTRARPGARRRPFSALPAATPPLTVRTVRSFRAAPISPPSPQTLAAMAACGSLGGWFLEPGRARRVGQDGGRPMRLLRWRRLLPPVLDAQLGQPAELAHVRRHQNQFVGKRNAGDKASYAPIDARSRAVL